MSGSCQSCVIFLMAFKAMINSNLTKRFFMKKNRSILFIIMMMLVSHSVLSTDGVVEINHICATQLGCFSGDTVIYPVRINGTAGKSYRLSIDLIISVENKFETVFFNMYLYFFL